MRRLLAHMLHRLAARIYNDSHHETLTIIDEWGITRCRVDVSADDSHGIESEFDQLPQGWVANRMDEA